MIIILIMYLYLYYEVPSKVVKPSTLENPIDENIVQQNHGVIKQYLTSYQQSCWVYFICF